MAISKSAAVAGVLGTGGGAAGTVAVAKYATSNSATNQNPTSLEESITVQQEDQANPGSAVAASPSDSSSDQPREGLQAPAGESGTNPEESLPSKGDSSALTPASPGGSENLGTSTGGTETSGQIQTQ